MLERENLKTLAESESCERQPKITVITVVFNAIANGRRALLLRALDSVQAQSFSSFEHLIVDGGSKDGTVELAKDYATRHRNVRVYSAPDKGIYHAMDRGIALAKGEYAVFLNSDDLFHNVKAFELSVSALRSGNYDFSYALTKVVDETGARADHLFVEANPYFIFAGMTICHQSIFVKRTKLIELDGFDRRYGSAADYELFLRMMFAGSRGVKVNEEIVTFTLGGFSQLDSGNKSNLEVARIFHEAVNRHLGFELPLAYWENILTTTHQMPPMVLVRLHDIAHACFGDEYKVSKRWWRDLSNAREACLYAAVAQGGGRWTYDFPYNAKLLASPGLFSYEGAAVDGDLTLRLSRLRRRAKRILALYLRYDTPAQCESVRAEVIVDGKRTEEVEVAADKVSLLTLELSADRVETVTLRRKETDGGAWVYAGSAFRYEKTLIGRIYGKLLAFFGS